MNEDINILEVVERYITGAMNPEERVYFEGLRKSNPEIDQLVVEHTLFLQQINRFDEVRSMKAALNETHLHLAEKGLIRSPRLKGRARVIYLYNRHKRVAAIAATIAGITALSISFLISFLAPQRKNDIDSLSREINAIKNQTAKQQVEINNVKQDINAKELPATPPINYTTGGTGFLVDTKGLLVTNSHVVENARHIAVQRNNGEDLSATLVYEDKEKDLAILMITDKRFKAPATLPYSIKKGGGELSEPIFTLGYPRNDIVYGEGYLAARTGYRGDTLSCQITVPANHGNSGSPILNHNGDIIGILTAKESTAEGAVFAIHSKYILNALTELQKDSTYRYIKIPQNSGLKGVDRTQQVKKISDFVYMVKVD